jgi:hypothetical protein
MAGRQGLELGRMPEALDLAQPARQWVPTGENLGHHVSQGSTWFRPMILRRSGFQPRPSVTILIRLTTRS